MVTRKPPTHEEIVTALTEDRSRYTGPNLPTGMGGIRWEEAIEHVRKGLKTVNEKAKEWMIEIVTDDTSPIMAVWSGVGRILAKAPREIMLTDLGWTEQNVRDLAFSYQGKLVLPTSKVARDRVGLIVVRRDQLEPMRNALTGARAVVEAERYQRHTAELMRFRELHTDSFDVISPIVGLVANESWKDDDLIKASFYEPGARFHGDGGSLTITLRGHQIEKFAQILRDRTSD